nr:hypothetical protein [Tanacetum cinerariifolium]
MGVSGIRSFVILIKHPTCLNDPLRIVLSVETRLRVIIAKDVLFSERNLREIYLHIVLKMEFYKILSIHPMTIPTLLILFMSHSLSNKTPVKIPHKVLHKSTIIVVTSVEPFNNQFVDELPQTVPSFDSTCYSEDGNSFIYDFTSNLVHDSPNVFDPPSQLPFYSCEFYRNDARYGHYCTPQVPFVYPEPCYNQDFNFPQDYHDFQQQYLCCENCEVTHEAYQCQPMNEDYYQEQNSCYDPNSFGFDQFQPLQYTVNHPIFNAQNDLFNSQNKLMEQLTSMYEFIKSSVKSLFPIPSESEGIPDNMCDVPFHDNSSPLDVSKDQFEDFSDSNDDSTSNDDDSFSIDNIEYVEASPPNSELVNSEVMEIVIPEVGEIDDDILLTIKDDILCEKMLNVNLLIANIKALNDNPTPSFDFMTKSSSTSLNSLLEETNTFDNSLPELETFCFDLEEISSGSTTTHFDISLSKYEAFYDDHVREISSGSTTTHSDSSLYDSFIFDLSINPFPPVDRRDFTMDVVEDTFPTREPRVHNALPTHPTLQLNMDFILFSESLFAYVVWIFLPFLSYSVAPQYLLSFGNEDTIFDLDICSYHISSFMLDVSNRSGTFIKFKVLNESPMEISFSSCSPMDQ